MSTLALNLKHLRSRRELTQAQVAEDVSISREVYSNYEGGRREPPIAILKRLAAFFKVSLDVLVGVDLTKLELDDLIKLEGNRVLLPIKVSTDNEDMIELVTQKASAGYLTGYADPEFIENLDTLSLPFLRRGKLRAFPIEGDSMLPLQDGSYVVGEYVERIDDFREGYTYVVVMRDTGIVYKRMFSDKENSDRVILYSDNEIYEPYSVRKKDIVEIWKFACSITLDEQNYRAPSIDRVISMLQRLKAEGNSG